MCVCVWNFAYAAQLMGNKHSSCPTREFSFIILSTCRIPYTIWYLHSAHSFCLSIDFADSHLLFRLLSMMILLRATTSLNSVFFFFWKRKEQTILCWRYFCSKCHRYRQTTKENDSTKNRKRIINFIGNTKCFYYRVEFSHSRCTITRDLWCFSFCFHLNDDAYIRTFTYVHTVFASATSNTHIASTVQMHIYFIQLIEFM